VTGERARLRMKDLCAETGLSRQAIHFYIQHGLLPEGTKAGRNMAWYGPEHVERLHLIRRLQEERLLPLKTIRALLDGDTAALPDAQRNLLAEVSSRLPATLVRSPERGVPVADALARFPTPPDELERMIELGFLVVHEHDGQREITADSVWLLDMWTQWRELGFTGERGFTVDDLAPFAAAAEQLVGYQAQLLLERLGHLDAPTVAPMIERGLPLIHATILHFHTAAVRAVFTQLGATGAVASPSTPE